jgi:uncharacterized membrane protein
MVIIWIILLIGFLYVLQLFLYNRYWKAGVVTSVRFKESAIFEEEEGVLEEEAVSAVGSVPEIVAQVVADVPLAKIAREHIKPKRRLSAGEITLLVLGSPLWLSLGIAAFAVILSLYCSLWAVIISLWAVFGAFAACSAGGVMACVIFAIGGNIASSVAILAAGMVCAGLSIFLFYGCKAATNGTLILTKKLATWLKTRFIKKEAAE